MIVGHRIEDGVIQFTREGCGCCEMTIPAESFETGELIESRNEIASLLTEIDQELKSRGITIPCDKNETKNPLA